MISKKTLEGYGFETIEDYYRYIIQSKDNGQPEQVKELVADMSRTQNKEFIIWHQYNMFDDIDIEFIKW